MSVDTLQRRAEAHLCAGETLRDTAEKLPQILAGETELHAYTIYRIRQLLLDVAQSEMNVVGHLLEVAEQQKEAAPC